MVMLKKKSTSQELQLLPSRINGKRCDDNDDDDADPRLSLFLSLSLCVCVCLCVSLFKTTPKQIRNLELIIFVGSSLKFQKNK